MGAKPQIDPKTGEILPINHGMTLRFQPMPKFYEDEKGAKTYKKKFFQYAATQISQTKVRVFVTFEEKMKDNTTRVLHTSGIGGFLDPKDFSWKAAVQAAFENAVAQMDFSS